MKIDITISANSTNDGEAQKLIDQVNIAADKNGDVVSCRTSIGQGNRRGGSKKKREILSARSTANVLLNFLIKTWDRKEVKIDITISANSTNDGEAQK